MLQRDESGKSSPQIQLFGFVVGAEIVEGTDLNQVMNRLSDALTFMEGIGKVDVEFLGPIELAEERPELTIVEATQ